MKSETTHHINIPTQVAEHLNVKPGDKLQLTLPDDDNEQVTIRPDKPAREHQTLPTRWFLLPSILASVLFFAYLSNQGINQIALAGTNSIASAVIILGIVSGSLSFLFFYGELSN
ncbi:AbrB/MazE/SpoVT family DNA-binding domain-containing protein [Furfurilactobacillus cerevisiae]|uniref:AbrB/MazE/SpoVT family DNA-binding domain-containing protein n=1 Tax=Furfurilactobacillus rossiae TaxID=231049 RepID=UPI003B984527